MAKSDETASEEAVETAKPKASQAPKLAKASESGDPAVQYLMALHDTHAANGDKEKAAEVEAQLAELGFGY